MSCNPNELCGDCPDRTGCHDATECLHGARLLERKRALEWIVGCFVPGDELKTYGDPTETLARIRDTARRTVGT